MIRNLPFLCSKEEYLMCAHGCCSRNEVAKLKKRILKIMSKLIVCVLLLFITGCGQSKEAVDKSSQSDISSFQSTEEDVFEDAFAMPAAGDSLDKEEALFYENAYEAYSEKCQELSEKYGNGRIVEHTVDTGGWECGCCYMSGLCFVDLIDFNGSEVKDLLVVYSQGENTGANIQGM